MSEMRLPERSDPPAPTPTPPPVTDKGPQSGSLALGVALAWAILVVGNMIVFGLLVGLAALLGRRPGALPFAFYAVGWIPFLVTVSLAIRMIVKGPKRTGIGIIIGIGSIWAVGLLLVAACFGIFFLGSGH